MDDYMDYIGDSNSLFQLSLSEQQALLARALKKCALAGDHIQMARILSHYGCTLLYLADQHKLTTVAQQILEEYRYESSDPRVQASYARFLAVHAVFAGDFTQAGVYYKQARRIYPLTDLSTEEFIMLLEANYWYYLLAGEWIEVFSSLERLQQLNQNLAGSFAAELIAFENSLGIYQGREYKELTLGAKESLGAQESNGMLWLSRVRTPALLLLNGWLAQGHKYNNELINEASFENYGIYPTLEMGLFQALKVLGSRQWLQGEEVLFPLAGKATILAHPWYIGLVNLLLGLNSYYGQRPKANNFFSAAGQAFSKLGCTELALICQEAATLPGWDAAKVRVTMVTPLPQLFTYIFALGQREVKRNPLSFNLFNQFQVYCASEPVNILNWGRKKAQELVLFLLVQPGYQASRDLILEEVFNYEDVQKASNQLYVTIHQANKIFGQLLDQGASRESGSEVNPVKSKNFVQMIQGKLRLNEEIIEDVDLPNYQKLVSVGLKLWPTDTTAGVELLQKAKVLYSSRLMPEYFYNWLERLRENLQSTQSSILKKLISYYLSKGAQTEILTLYEELVAVDPLDEYPWQEYITYLLKIGSKTEAQLKYNKYTKLLREQLQLEPSAELTWLLKAKGNEMR
ncbi:MAG: AfsR/SARP family transcriptional regulator [Carboxydocellales bacterium]